MQSCLSYCHMFQELLASMLGAALFLCVGLVTLESYSHPEYGAPAGKVLAGLCFGVVATLVANSVLIGCTLKR